MRKKSALLAVCIAFGTPAVAQADQNNPFRDMARKFIEGRDFWQDQKFQYAYNNYFDCYEKYVTHALASKKGPEADDLFHGAYTSCEALRKAGQATAETRIADFHPEMSTDERASTATLYRRTLAALRLGPFFKKNGLAKSYDNYFHRTAEF